MLTFVTVAIAVLVGCLMAYGVLVLIITNTHVMKRINRKALAISEEIAQEYLEAEDK